MRILYKNMTATSLLVIIALSVFMFTRVWLLGMSGADAHLTVFSFFNVFARGLLFDLTIIGFFLIPVFLWKAALPANWRNQSWHKILITILFSVTVYALLFGAVSEYYFWEEFGTRYNFIAVDYLIYRREVTDNINESYPVLAWVVSIAVATIATTWASRSILWQQADSARWRALFLALLWPILGWFCVSESMKYFTNNRYQQELSGNGIYDFLYAFNHAELDFKNFYITEDQALVNRYVKKEVQEDTATFVKTDDPLLRHIDNLGNEKRLNVMLVVVESLSGEYLGVFGGTRKITPNLDRLAEESLFFTNLYAAGTRTVRGLEAISLSIPPTPGESIVKRPHNENMRTLGTVFREHGYDTKFIYGGFGYFDNMNDYFRHNDFDIVDRSDMSDSEVTFSNAWGVADEDLFRRAMKEADISYKNGKPFMSLLMTTSNHRPYTYPEGRIDIPSGSQGKKGRSGAVKYTDFAIGQFLEEAKKHSWYTDTVFVIVADHCAGSAGKSELPVENYHIPMFIYSPTHIKPMKVDALASQIDFAPTLLALLNFDYDSTFFGRDILATPTEKRRAFISTYQAVGLLTQEQLGILWPQQRMQLVNQPFNEKSEVVEVNESTDFLQRTIGLYQGADDFWQQHLKMLGVKKNND